MHGYYYYIDIKRKNKPIELKTTCLIHWVEWSSVARDNFTTNIALSWLIL